MDVRRYNRAAWDNEVVLGNPWTIPVTRKMIQRARRGDWHFFLTPMRPVPREWLPASLDGLAALCLGAGGGQQGPMLAAVGAAVTVWDLSPRQLGQDRRVARQNQLDVTTIQGDMTDLSRLADETFDLVIQGVAGAYVPDVRPVWREAFRVLRPGGLMIAAFDTPTWHIFDRRLANRGVLMVRHRLPYSDVDHLSREELAERCRANEPLIFGHTLEEQIGGQIDAGFIITGLFEDRFTPWQRDALSDYMPTFVVTRAVKPR